MGLLDYTYRLKAQSGDTTPHDELGVSSDLSGGTITLQENSGDYAWRFVGIALVAGPTKTLAVSTDGGGVTVAIRLKVVSASATSSASYVRYRVVGANTGPALIRYSSTQVRGRHVTGIDTATIFTHGSGFKTYVLKFSMMNASSQDKLSLWISDGSGDAADSNSSLTNATSVTLGEIQAGVADGTIEVSDFVTWSEELTGAQCRALATDIRGALDAGGATDATATGGTGAGAGSGSGGDAAGAAGAAWGEASAAGGSGSGTGSGTGGDAAGTSSGSFTTSPMYSSGIRQAAVSASWTWYAGTIGAAPSALVHGAGTNSAAGTLTASGLPVGVGFLLAKTADGAIYYEAGTVV